MSGLNQIELIGNVGNEPRTLTFTDGNKQLNFSIAINESYKDEKGGYKEATTWINCSVVGSLYPFAEKVVVKGYKVYISGKLILREYTNEMGENVKTTSVRVNKLIPLTPKS